MSIERRAGIHHRGSSCPSCVRTGKQKAREAATCRPGRRRRLCRTSRGWEQNEREPEIRCGSNPAKGHLRECKRSRRGRDRDRPERQHLRGCRRQAHAGRRCRHDDRHGVRDLLDHQGDHRHGVPAAGRGRQARPRRAGQDLCAGDRQAAGARGLRRQRQARSCGRPSATSPRGCCCCTRRASATTSSTRSTTASRRSTASRA